VPPVVAPPPGNPRYRGMDGLRCIGAIAVVTAPTRLAWMPLGKGASSSVPGPSSQWFKERPTGRFAAVAAIGY